MNKEGFWKNVMVTDAPAHNPSLGPCAVWTRAISKGGYGVVFVDGVQYRAHRFAFIDTVGPIPKDQCIDHLCRNRACCNVAHMDVVTPAENTRRSVSYRKTRNGRMPSNWTAIRADRVSGMTYRELASKYKMSVSGIYLACNKA